MITIKNEQEQAYMRDAGIKLATLFERMPGMLTPGVSTHEIDEKIAQFLAAEGMVSQSKGYHGYKHVSCISINDEVVHGIPSKGRVLKAGDLVKVDVCAALNGYCADMARSYCVGHASTAYQRLINAAQEALDAGIQAVRVGGYLGDISHAIQTTAERYGAAVVRDFAGHGIGRKMHEDPEVLNYGRAGTGPQLQVGMAFALEPMITAGKYEVYVDRDGWTVKTADKSIAAHVEDTVLITERGVEVITRLKKDA